MRYAVWLVAALSVTGCYGAQSLGEGKDETSIDSAEVQRGLLDRWNTVVDHEWNTVVLRHPAAGEFDFHWLMFRQFPHPTFNGHGESEAYAAFAHLLLVFLEDHFDYLAEHHVFDATLYYDFGNSNAPDTYTFRELVDMFVGPDSFYTDEPVRRGLEEMATRIEEVDS